MDWELNERCRLPSPASRSSQHLGFQSFTKQKRRVGAPGPSLQAEFCFLRHALGLLKKTYKGELSEISHQSNPCLIEIVGLPFANGISSGSGDKANGHEPVAATTNSLCDGEASTKLSAALSFQTPKIFGTRTRGFWSYSNP